jgi:ribosomal protein L34E
MRCHYNLNGEFVACKEVAKINGITTPGGYMKITPEKWLSKFNYCPYCGTYLNQKKEE